MNQLAAMKKPRFEGLDLARFLAFFGMVLVNFKVVAAATADAATPGLVALLHQGLEGRAAALFVLLAGVGIGLGFANKAKDNLPRARMGLAKRGGVLFVFGLLNLLIFDADILHYYGLYFIFACLFLTGSRRMQMIAALGLILAFPLVAMVSSYDAGWDWKTLSYDGFWTAAGFVRHSLLNGWHPVLPWLAFVLVGMAIAQLDLARATTRIRLVIAGLTLIIASWFFARVGADIAALPEVAADRELVDALTLIFSLSPIPPAPLYMLSATGSALVMLALCLWLGDWFGQSLLLEPFVATGKQALTLYIAHILIGMGIMEVLGMVAIETTNPAASLSEVTIVALIFILSSMIYSSLWQRFVGQGPLEMLLRRLSR